MAATHSDETGYYFIMIDGGKCYIKFHPEFKAECDRISSLREPEHRAFMQHTFSNDQVGHYAVIAGGVITVYEKENDALQAAVSLETDHPGVLVEHINAPKYIHPRLCY